MFVSGKPRGNAPQLANYLTATGKNERIIILDVDGRPNADAAYLKQVMHSMELNSELTRSGDSVYHAMINPDPESQQDRAMTMEEWHRASEQLAQNLNFEQQRRITVLHDKDGRLHGHVVFERYNHERGIMVDYKHNYRAHDKTRFQLEKEFGHKPTPQKNPNQPEHKKRLTDIWRQTNTGEAFIKLAFEHGYQIARGTDRPFRVIDEHGVSFDLVRQLDGVKTKEVKERLGGEKLMEDKEAISKMSALKREKDMDIPLPNKKQVTETDTLTEVLAEPKDDKFIDNPPTAEEPQPAKPDVAVKDKRQELIDSIKAEKEQNQSRNKWVRNMAMLIIVALRVTFSFRPLRAENESSIRQQFLGNKAIITNREIPKPVQVFDFIRSSHHYKPT